MQKILERLYQGKKISYKQSKYIFQLMLQNKLSKEQIAAILISMKIRGETYEEIAGALLSTLDKVKYFPIPKYPFADIVGTGGDCKNTINISTASAFVAAGCGAKIAKHNNKSISSISGSSDILEKFGINLYMSAEKSRKALDELGVCFLFAPKYHDCFNKNIIEVRKILKISTIFNILGPLMNPTHPPLILIGVYDPKISLLIAKTLKLLKYKKALIVHSGGMDEVTLHDTIQIVELNNEEIINYYLTASDFGLEPQPLKHLFINSIQENYNITSSILKGTANFAQESVIAANVALLLKLFGHENLKKNTCLALNEIQSGKSYTRMMSLIARG